MTVSEPSVADASIATCAFALAVKSHAAYAPLA
jgi:hypothetical protein